MYEQIMFDFWNALLIGNIIFFLLYFPTAVINFKYYYDLKLKDNLLVGLYFLFMGLQVLKVAIAIKYDIDYLFFYVDITNSIALNSLFIVGVRILWSRIPKIIYPLLMVYLYHFGAAFFTISFEGRINVPEAFLIPYIELFTFVLYAILRSKYPLTIAKIKITRNFRLTGVILNIFALGYFDFIVSNDILASPQLIFYIGLLPQYISALVFFILHVFFPDAVLFSEEQLYRARKIFTKVESLIKPTSKLKIGSAKITNYLNSIPLELQEQLSIKHSTSAKSS